MTSPWSLPLISSTLRAHARTRGWDKLRLLSAGASTFKYDLGSEDREGNQDSTISVFTRDADGTVRHFYSAHPRMAPDIQERGIDLLAPIWHFMDLTRQGRGNWYASLDYGTASTPGRATRLKRVEKLSTVNDKTLSLMNADEHGSNFTKEPLNLFAPEWVA